MTIRFTLTLTVEGAATATGATTHAVGATIERDELTAEALGLTLAEGKAILAELQAVVVAEQATAHEAAARRCAVCGTARGIKDHYPLTCRTTFGTLPLRFRPNGCAGTCMPSPRARSRTGRAGPGRAVSATWTRCRLRTGRPTSAWTAASCGTAPGPGSR